MSLQNFHTAQSAISFPQLTTGAGAIVVCAAQLRKLWWHAPAQKLVGVFTTAPTDYDFQLAAFLQFRVRLMYLWRDGTPIDLVTTPIRGFEGSTTLQMSQTSEAEVVRSNFQEDVAKDEISAILGDALFTISERWAQDILPVRAASAGLLGIPYEASYLVGASAGYVVVGSVAAGTFRILAQPGGSIVFSATGGTWRHPRDLVYIDGQHTAATFMPDSGGTVNGASAALVRLFATSTTPWTLLWTDELPATDSVMAYDPANAVIYSCGKWSSNAVMHSSKLKQSPASLSVITLGSGTTLQEMRGTLLSVLVTDSLGSGISGATVQWLLSASLSGGSLLSAYSKSNTSGVATMLYIGPRLSAVSMTETVSAAVATIDPVGS